MKHWAFALMIFAGLSATSASARQDDPFPHQAHQGLFPSCASCHAGMESGTASDAYPQVSACANCHDGTLEQSVDWDGPTLHPSNLLLDHVRHAQVVVADGDSASCFTCHQGQTPVGRMDVARARPETCLACHQNATGTHLDAEADCRQCHIPLAEATGFDESWVAVLPQPPTHDRADFLMTHGAVEESAASCSVCHARESCSRCHLNATTVPAIANLPADARVAALVDTVPAEYPTPQTHSDTDWKWKHAESHETAYPACGNCHAQSSCRLCHVEARDSPIDSLPRAVPGGPRGVMLGDGAPTVHTPNFENTHGPFAVGAEASCAGCHSDEAFCIDCHRGPGRPVFHLPNYLERHSADAFGAQADCTSCHNTEVFCRGCHAGQGLASEGRLDVAFHTAKPFWLLGHGESARQGLDKCAACHSQNDCTRCHSAVGAWRINPHGPDFDGSRWRTRNELTCLRCHRQVPNQ